MHYITLIDPLLVTLPEPFKGRLSRNPNIGASINIHIIR